MLENGLEVVLQRDPSAQSAVVWLSYHVGMRDEQERGLAHLAEHLSFRGVSKISGMDKISLLQRRGGLSNAFVTPDETVYFAVVPPSELALPLWIESDRMLYARKGLDPQLVEDEVEIVEREYAGGNRGAVVPWIKAAYPIRHPYYQMFNEEPDADHDLHVVVDFMARHYRPDNATLVITGQIDPDVALQLVERYFGEVRVPPRAEPRAPAPAVAYRGRETWTLGRLAPRSSIRMQWAVDCTHGDCLADLWLLRAALVGGDGPLYRALTVEHEVATSLRAEVLGRAEHQELLLQIGLAPSATPKDVQKLVDGVLASYARTPLDDVTFRVLRTDALTQWLDELESPTGRAARLARHRDPKQPNALWDDERLRERLEALQPGDLQRAAARFVPTNRCLVVHVNSNFKRAYSTREGTLGFAP